MNTDTNVQDVEPVESELLEKAMGLADKYARHSRDAGAADSALAGASAFYRRADDAYTELRALLANTAASLAAITADRDRIREALELVVSSDYGSCKFGFRNIPYAALDAARKSLESQ